MLLKVFGTTVMIHNLSTLVSRIQAEENNVHQMESWIALKCHLPFNIAKIPKQKKKYIVTLLLPHNDIALPKSDQYQFFPNNIHLQTGEGVKRIHKVITKGEML